VFYAARHPELIPPNRRTGETPAFVWVVIGAKGH